MYLVLVKLQFSFYQINKTFLLHNHLFSKEILYFQFLKLEKSHKISQKDHIICHKHLFFLIYKKDFIK